MGQASSEVLAAYCPFCGASVGVAGARFCAVCGRDMLTGTPNAGQAAPPPVFTPQPGLIAAMRAGPAVNTGRMIWIGVGYMVGIVLPVMLVFPRASDGLILAAAVFLFGIRRLATTSWIRTLADAFGFIALLLVTFTVMSRFVVGRLFGLYYVVYFFGAAFIEFIVISAIFVLIGVLFAGWSASWKNIRARVSPYSGGQVRYAGILLVVAVALQLAHAIPTPFIAYKIDSAVGPLATLVILLAWGFIAPLILMIIGSALNVTWLNRLLALSAAPAWSPPAAPAWSPPAPSGPSMNSPIMLDPNR